MASSPAALIRGLPGSGRDPGGPASWSVGNSPTNTVSIGDEGRDAVVESADQRQPITQLGR